MFAPCLKRSFINVRKTLYKTFWDLFTQCKNTYLEYIYTIFEDIFIQCWHCWPYSLKVYEMVPSVEKDDKFKLFWFKIVQNEPWAVLLSFKCFQFETFRPFKNFHLICYHFLPFLLKKDIHYFFLVFSNNLKLWKKTLKMFCNCLFVASLDILQHLKIQIKDNSKMCIIDLDFA